MGIHPPALAVPASLCSSSFQLDMMQSGFFNQMPAAAGHPDQTEPVRKKITAAAKWQKKPKTPAPAELLHCHFLSSGSLKGTFHVELKVELNWSHKSLCRQCVAFHFRHCNWMGATPSHQGSESKRVSATSDISIQSLEHFKSFPQTNKHNMFSSPPPLFINWTYLIWLHDPFVQLRLILWSLTMKSHQHPYRSRRRAETRCAWDCGGTSPRMSRSPERTTPPGKPNTPAVGPVD